MSPLARTPKASGLTARILSSCRKWRDALRGGSSWTTSHPSRGACAASAARKPWTAAVCSVFLSSWRPLLPVTLRHSKGPSASSRATLHRFLARRDGCAVPAGQQRQPPVGEGQPSARVAGPGREAEAFEGDDAVGDPLGRDAHQPGQLLEGDPGPVGDEVEGASAAVHHRFSGLRRPCGTPPPSGRPPRRRRRSAGPRRCMRSPLRGCVRRRRVLPPPACAPSWRRRASAPCPRWRGRSSGGRAATRCRPRSPGPCPAPTPASWRRCRPPGRRPGSPRWRAGCPAWCGRGRPAWRGSGLPARSWPRTCPARRASTRSPRRASTASRPRPRERPCACPAAGFPAPVSRRPRGSGWKRPPGRPRRGPRSPGTLRREAPLRRGSSGAGRWWSGAGPGWPAPASTMRSRRGGSAPGPGPRPCTGGASCRSPWPTTQADRGRISSPGPRCGTVRWTAGAARRGWCTAAPPPPARWPRALSK